MADERTGYWWQCNECSSQYDFTEVTNSKSTAAFIWDELLPAGWDQSLLTQSCPECSQQTLRITYAFPRANREVIQAIHVVGLTPYEGDTYVPMIWETSAAGKEKNWIDFKYINKRNNWGLNKTPVFTRDSFREVIQQFNDKADSALPL